LIHGFEPGGSDSNNVEPGANRGVLLVHITCVKTVSEPLGLGPMEICFERKADSPSYCFFEEAVRKRRAFRAGVCAPKVGASRRQQRFSPSQQVFLNPWSGTAIRGLTFTPE